jgi:flagellar biosynthesis regulator FlbT
MQSDAASLPATATYFPAAQLMQSDAPATATYFPAAQLMQSDAASLPAKENFPAAQLMQLAFSMLK